MARKVIIAVLLLFVTVTVGYMLYDHSRQAGLGEARSEQPSPTPSGGDTGELGETLESGVRTVTAYYFFMKPRCVTCNNVEAYTREAVEQGFPEEVKAGRIKFVALDCGKPENEHYLMDYMLDSKALVLVAREKDMPEDWRNLKEIWDRVSDKPDYLSYVRTEIKDLLHTEEVE